MRATSARRAPQRHIIDRTRNEPDKAYEPGACPHCFRVIAINPNGRRRAHKDLRTGQRCTGSSVHVGDYPKIVLDGHPGIVLPRRQQRWAGKATPQPKPPRVDPLACPECGRHIKIRSDGQRKAHRVEADNPVASYCPGGGPKART